MQSTTVFRSVPRPRLLVVYITALVLAAAGASGAVSQVGRGDERAAAPQSVTETVGLGADILQCNTQTDSVVLAGLLPHAREFPSATEWHAFRCDT
jgi:hypothetical protein